jgi:hypothetical protein
MKCLYFFLNFTLSVSTPGRLKSCLTAIGIEPSVCNVQDLKPKTCFDSGLATKVAGSIPTEVKQFFSLPGVDALNFHSGK